MARCLHYCSTSNSTTACLGLAPTKFPSDSHLFFNNIKRKRERKEGRGSIKSKLTQITLAARGAGRRDGRPHGLDVSIVGVFDDDPSPTERRHV